jgi:hypothetical protein
MSKRRIIEKVVVTTVRMVRTRFVQDPSPPSQPSREIITDAEEVTGPRLAKTTGLAQVVPLRRRTA